MLGMVDDVVQLLLGGDLGQFLAGVVAVTPARLLRLAGLDQMTSHMEVTAVLDERLRPVAWTPGADRFTRGQLDGSRPLTQTYADPRAQLLGAVREVGKPIRIEVPLSGITFDASGAATFAIEPIRDDSRVVGLALRAQRPGGGDIYAPSREALDMPYGALARIGQLLAPGQSPELAMQLLDIRLAARDAVLEELRPLLPALRRAAREGRPRSRLELPARQLA